MVQVDLLTCPFVGYLRSFRKLTVKLNCHFIVDQGGYYLTLVLFQYVLIFSITIWVRLICCVTVIIWSFNFAVPLVGQITSDYRWGRCSGSLYGWLVSWGKLLLVGLLLKVIYIINYYYNFFFVCIEVLTCLGFLYIYTCIYIYIYIYIWVYWCI